MQRGDLLLRFPLQGAPLCLALRDRDAAGAVLSLCSHVFSGAERAAGDAGGAAEARALGAAAVQTCLQVRS